MTSAGSSSGGRGVPPIAWDAYYLPKQDGGLEIRDAQL